jgi:proteasome lid subunit RPN8/RPN11
MLTLPRALADAMRRHAERDYPDECCGVLLGRIGEEEREVVEARACANLRAGESRGRERYAIAPEELIAAQREARGRGLVIAGFYHSHPDHPAEPSAADTAEAYWVGSVYVIVSVSAGAAGELAAYLLEAANGERRFVPEAVIVV